MRLNLVTLWIILSFAVIIIADIWGFIDTENYTTSFLSFNGWMSSLLPVGYYSTPSNSIYGKVAYGFVVLMVTGIIFKILHFTFASEIIIIGLIGILVTYAVMWFGSKSKSKD